LGNFGTCLPAGKLKINIGVISILKHRNMNAKRALFIFIVFIISACCSVNQDIEKNTYSYFSKHLKKDMNYEAIIQRFGKPARDIGRGIHIYIYPLNDGTEIGIGYTDWILYARHADKNRRMLHDLFPPAKP
jgi:hypothetical protein